jgi:hypothetical protein
VEARSRSVSGADLRFDAASERAERSIRVSGEREAARQMERIWSGGGGGEDLRREMARRVFWRVVRGVFGEDGLRMDAGVGGGVAAAVESRRRSTRRMAAAMAASGLGFRMVNGKDTHTTVNDPCISVPPLHTAAPTCQCS